MPAVSQPGYFNVQEFTDLGAMAVGGRIYTYSPGTTTNKNAYTESTGTTTHTYTSDGSGGQYIALNARGELPYPLYLQAGGYDITYKTSAGATVWTRAAVGLQDSLTTTLASLAASGGAALIGWIQAGANAILRTLQAKVRERVSAADFSGYDPTGVSDSKAAITSAFTSLGAAGGTVYINNGDKVLIDTDLTIPKNCHLVGPHRITGTPGSNAAAAYGDLGGAIYLNSTKTITMSPGSSISGLFIIRKGMTFPAQDSTAYAGTAITCAGDDVYVSSRIIGFEKAFVSTGYSRIKLEMDFDCLPGGTDGAIELTSMYDSSYVQLHGWPFGTIEAYSTATSGGTVNLAANAYRLQRDGYGLKVRGASDDLTMNGLIYGYLHNWDFASCGNLQFGTAWGDGTGYYTNSVGFNFGTGVTGVKANNLRAFSNDYNFIIGMDSQTKIIAAMIEAQQGTNDAITISGGDVNFGDVNTKTNSGAAIYVSTTNSRVHINSLSDFSNTYANPIKIASGVRYEDIEVGGVLSDKAVGTSLVGGADTLLYQIASAATINLPLRPDVFYVTGTTNISTINGMNGGRECTFIFQDVLTVNNGAGNLRIGSNFTTNAGSVLRLVANPHNVWLNQSARNQN